MTAVYVTARSMESAMRTKSELDKSKRATDDTLLSLEYWPGQEEDGHMYKSPLLFAAVLDRHRELVKVGNYYQDEILFYTNIIDVLFGWLTREVEMFGDTTVWRWLLAYTYLMGSINYLGAEQALCSVYFSMVCFSHRETFYYSNYSFAGEAAFRMYRQSYPDERGGGWKTSSHNRFFPNLMACREEIIADLHYQGMSIDPSLCDESRKNETKFHETDILTLHEHQRLNEAIAMRMHAEVDQSAFHFILSGVVLGALGSYFLLLHILRCTFIRCVQSRSTRKWEPKDTVIEEEKLDSLTMSMETNMIKYEEYNCKPNAIHVKVATV